MLAYDERGAGDAVLLLHAGVADRTMWREHLDGIAGAGFRAIALDLPGFGDTPVQPGAQTPWNDVLDALQALSVRHAVVVGNSFGAAVALRAAVVAPAAVSGLVLISPPPLDLEPSPVLRAAWEAEADALQRGDIDAAVAAVVQAWLRPDAPESLRKRVAAMQRKAFELQAGAAGASDAPDPLERDPDALQRLDIPILVMAGTSDMPDFVAGAREIAGRVPNARLEMIEGAGHLAPLETAESFAKLLLEFLEAA